MREDYESGLKPYGVLEDYRRYRNSENWRVSRTVEELCEYILFLESLVDFDFDNALTFDQLPESLQNKLK